MAAEEPAGPAPTIATSNRSMSSLQGKKSKNAKREKGKESKLPNLCLLKEVPPLAQGKSPPDRERRLPAGHLVTGKEEREQADRERGQWVANKVASQEAPSGHAGPCP